MIAPLVQQAVDEIRASFEGHQVDVNPDGSGGARVTVHDVEFGPKYEPARGNVGFHVTFQYPHADVYPHYTVPRLKVPDGTGLSSAFWEGQPATQISRRSNSRNPATDTAAMKLSKVLEWLRTR